MGVQSCRIFPGRLTVRNWRGSSDCREWSFSTISKPTHTVLPRLAGTTWCRSTSRPARCGETQRSSRPEPDWSEAGLYWDGSVHRPFATEAGHADFAAQRARRRICCRICPSFPTVNIERVLSGAGLYRIYTFLRRRAGRPEPSWLTEAFRQHEGPAAISAAALNGTDETAVAALRLFVSCLGAEAGNLALRMMALGGVYVGGGIAPKILSMLSDGVFISAFVDKGRMRSLLETIPVWVIRNDKTALIGAARAANRRKLNRRWRSGRRRVSPAALPNAVRALYKARN